jgi:hypothetical protein
MAEGLKGAKMRLIQLSGDVFGALVEVPVPVFVQGVQWGLFGLWVEPRSLVLLKGRPDEVGSYVRCSWVGKHGTSCCDSNFKPEYPGMRENGIPLEAIERALPISRTLIDENRFSLLNATKSDRMEDRAARQFGDYVIAASNRVATHRDATFTFADWVLTRPESSQENLQEILRSGILDRCIELHRRYYLPGQ